MPKMKKKIIAAIVLILAAALLAAPFAKLHFIRKGGGGGTVLWNSEGAYLFLYDCDDGFVFKVPEYLAEPINQYV
jgi:hypothetical protein